MSPCAGEGQNEYVIVFFVYQQPVGGDVALSVTEPLSFKVVIAVACGESDTLREQLHRMGYGGDIAPTSGAIILKSFLKRDVGLTSYIGNEQATGEREHREQETVSIA